MKLQTQCMRLFAVYALKKVAGYYVLYCKENLVDEFVPSDLDLGVVMTMRPSCLAQLLNQF